MEQEIAAVAFGVFFVVGGLVFRRAWPWLTTNDPWGTGRNMRAWGPFGRFIGGLFVVIGAVMAAIGSFWLIRPN